MKLFNILMFSFLLISLQSASQNQISKVETRTSKVRNQIGKIEDQTSSVEKQTNPMDYSKITNKKVKTAIEALQNGDKKTWFASFTPNTVLLDDGHKIDFRKFSEDAVGHERFISIDFADNGGLHIKGKFHSDQWGDFKTYFIFHLNDKGIFDKLEIGQANY